MLHLMQFNERIIKYITATVIKYNLDASKYDIMHSTLLYFTLVSKVNK